MTLAPLGDSAVVVTLGSSIDESTMVRVRSLSAALELERAAGIVDVVPAYTTVTVFYEIASVSSVGMTPYERICRVIRDRAAQVEHSWPDVVRANLGESSSNGSVAIVEVPVCYGGEFGPDLEEVAQHAGMSAAEVIALHSNSNYIVHAVGFAPGFPYLGGLPEKLQTPRRATARTSVPAGSVGIGGKQTGIYPIASPGGWQLIGRTPLALFQPARNPPSLVRVGDHVKFRGITAGEFAAWK